MAVRRCPIWSMPRSRIAHLSREPRIGKARREWVLLSIVRLVLAYHRGVWLVVVSRQVILVAVDTVARTRFRLVGGTNAIVGIAYRIEVLLGLVLLVLLLFGSGSLSLGLACDRVLWGRRRHGQLGQVRLKTNGIG